MKNKPFNFWGTHWTVIFCLLGGIFFALSCDKTEHKGHKHSDSGKSKNIETFYTCPMHPQVRESGPGKCPICSMNLVKIQVDKSAGKPNRKEDSSKKQELWRCEDYPDVTSARKDICPLDGSEMVPVEQGGVAGEVIGQVKLRRAQLRHFRPSFFPVTKMSMHKKVRLLGEILPSEEKESAVPTRVPGRVEKVYIESTGSFVKAGDPVVDIYSPELITGGEEYLLARKNYNKEKNKTFKELLEQSKERLRLWGIQQWQMESWHKDGRIPRSITIYSSESGIVQKRNAVVGKYFKEGENLFELSELSSVWVEMDVYEHDAGLVKLGQKVELSFTALPGVEVGGELDFISPVLNPKSRTLKVRSTITNPKGRLKPGMAAEAILDLEIEGMPLVVPRNAIIDTGKRKVVWIKLQEDLFQAKQIKSGFESEGYVEVIDGLKEGDEVVIEANFLLDAQAQLFGGYEDFNEKSKHD